MHLCNLMTSFLESKFQDDDERLREGTFSFLHILRAISDSLHRHISPLRLYDQTCSVKIKALIVHSLLSRRAAHLSKEYLLSHKQPETNDLT